MGLSTVRFNFRGVGKSQGQYDQGIGETNDLLAILQWLKDVCPEQSIWLAGFSFGAYVASHAAAALRPARLVLIGPASANFTVAAVAADTLVVHGEADEVVPLSATLDWARPQALPVVVVPGGGHFFLGQLPLLKSLVVRHLSAPAG